MNNSHTLGSLRYPYPPTELVHINNNNNNNIVRNYTNVEVIPSLSDVVSQIDMS